MLDYLMPWRRKPARHEAIDVGVLAESGDVVVMFPGEGIPRRYPAALAFAIAQQVNAHEAVYARLVQSPEKSVDLAAQD